jgi:NAD(P)-dependent dehydrogenase (short-subunit alcohol dehydrogenase family)
MDLAGKSALVTGASRGIGRGIAVAYARAGADVAVLARNEQLLNEVAAEIEALGRKAVVVPGDVTDRDSVDRAVAEAVQGLGKLDVLVNNAGGNSFSAPLANMRFSGWEKTLRLNLDSAVHVIQATAPHLLNGNGGSVINVASVAGLSGVPLMSHYGAAKAAVISVTKSLALEWAWAKVRVNALVPGWIETDLTAFMRENPEAGKAMISRVPMQRWGTVEEIAAPALFLASDASSFMTGATLVVDGGLSVMP